MRLIGCGAAALIGQREIDFDVDRLSLAARTLGAAVASVPLGRRRDGHARFGRRPARGRAARWPGCGAGGGGGGVCASSEPAVNVTSMR